MHKALECIVGCTYFEGVSTVGAYSLCIVGGKRVKWTYSCCVVGSGGEGVGIGIK